MADSDDDGREKALESARRVYDQQVETLDAIDDFAMRPESRGTRFGG